MHLSEKQKERKLGRILREKAMKTEGKFRGGSGESWDGGVRKKGWRGKEMEEGGEKEEDGSGYLEKEKEDAAWMTDSGRRMQPFKFVHDVC